MFQDHFRQGPSSGKMKKREKSRRYWEKKREREQEMADREDDGRGQSSHCKFYKDGKCSRVGAFLRIKLFCSIHKIIGNSLDNRK